MTSDAELLALAEKAIDYGDVEDASVRFDHACSPDRISQLIKDKQVAEAKVVDMAEAVVEYISEIWELEAALKVADGISCDTCRYDVVNKPRDHCVGEHRDYWALRAATKEATE